ncbi:MAG: hypothetical protein KKH91_04405 [Elusimicrobia bacterium]|nr:hypothetical protein [Elusimicrobiota bacterium]MBU2614180.1 hypothetical protein [Elusimicrobiota bacterium]
MNKEQLRVLKELLDYMKVDEQRHFGECGRPKKHIYRNIMYLEKYFRSKSGNYKFMNK